MDGVSTTFIGDDPECVLSWIIGALVDIYLSGLLTSLLIDYARNEWIAISTRSKNGSTLGRWWLRGLILVVTVLCILKTAIACYILIAVGVIDHSGSILDNWPTASTPLLTGLIGLTVQIYYIRRLDSLLRVQTGRILSQNWFRYSLISAVLCFSLTSLAFVSACTNMILKHEVDKFLVFYGAHLGAAFLSDALITTFTISCMLKANDRVINEAKRSLLGQIVRFTAFSAAAPACLALLNLLFIVWGDESRSRWHIVLNFALGKAWPLSLMCTLEYRRRVVMCHAFQSTPLDHRQDEIALEHAKDGGDTGAIHPVSDFARTVSFYDLEHKPG